MAKNAVRATKVGKTSGRTVKTLDKKGSVSLSSIRKAVKATSKKSR